MMVQRIVILFVLICGWVIGGDTDLDNALFLLRPVSAETYADTATTQSQNEGSGKIADPDVRTAFLNAVREGALDEVQALIQVGADVNAKNSEEWNRMPLRIAASEGHLEVMLALLEAGAEANAMRSGALGAAAFQGYLEIVDVLLKAGADSTAIANVDLEPLAALVRAARDGEIEEVKSLIHSGADVNEESSNGWTPLILDFGHFLTNKAATLTKRKI